MDTPHDTTPLEPQAPAHASDDLDAYLAAVARDDCYRVIRPLGATARAAALGHDAADLGTVTELVQFEGANGAALGPFVRKRIDLSLGIGAAYEELYAAQRAGVRFAHVPHVVECYKTGRELVVVSEYVPGETLEAYVHRVGPGVPVARRVMPAVCAAVSELHQAFDPPIVHRDLKPSNVIVTSGVANGGPALEAEDLTATLIDLGIARRFRRDATADTVRFGTRAYAPPEQYGFGQTSVRSDVYALGMIALFCCTGTEPQGQPTAQMLAAADVPAGLAAVILQATSFDPAQRYESAGAFSAALLGCADGGVPAEAARFGAVAGPMETAQSGPATDPVEPAQSLAASGGLHDGTAHQGRSTSGPAAGHGEDPAPASSEAASDEHHAVDDGRPFEPRQLPPEQTVLIALGLAKQAAAFMRRHHTVATGHVWNALLALVAALFVVTATQQVGGPVDGVVYPFWYALFLTYGISLPVVLGVMYLMVDRKSLACFAPRLAARSRLRDARNLVIYLTAAFVVGMIASSLF